VVVVGVLVAVVVVGAAVAATGLNLWFLNPCKKSSNYFLTSQETHSPPLEKYIG
jgi:uncharacterized membrane protein